MNNIFYICTLIICLHMHTDMDIASRLSLFRDYTQLSNSQFADRAGIPRPTFSQFLNGRNKRLSDDLATKLHIAFPELNMLWLLFGEGSMLIDSNIEISETSEARFSKESAPHLSGKQYNSSQKNLFSDLGVEEENRKSQSDDTNKAQQLISTIGLTTSKTVQYVMVFYSDNSFEVFKPT